MFYIFHGKGKMVAVCEDTEKDRLEVLNIHGWNKIGEVENFDDAKDFWENYKEENFK